jgi:hypothetical protein
MTSRGRKILYTGASLAFALVVGLFVLAEQTRVSPDVIRTSVTRTDSLINEAWSLPVAATFKREVRWQSNPSMCGPASVANIRRSMTASDASESSVLKGTGLCWSGFCWMGLRLDELATVAQNTGRSVSVLRDLTPEQFKEHLRRSNDAGRRYIINFNRAVIFGAGAGHHSPIGGYLEAEDLVFVLDVNRDYQPWLVERSRLFAAMDTFDGERKRGLLLIE